MNVQEFIEKHGLILKVVQIPSRTDSTVWDSVPVRHKNKFTGDIEERLPTHWNCKLLKVIGDPANTSNLIAAEKTAMKFEFSMGAGHYTAPIPPEINGVLECLRSDIVPFGMSFEDWCGECDYDTDSRRAENMFKACLDSTAKLFKLLGAEGTEELQKMDT